jgi:dTDP-3,4-didehydro-2,6-dideoxy-alpha-D-glucose 3-reductase
MKILFVGYSNVIKQRILPFIHELSDLQTVDIAKFENQIDEINFKNFEGTVYNNYNDALNESKADIAYISTVNSSHAEWVRKALLKGYHVIVDKPAFLDFKTAEETVRLAEKLNLCLAEATVYAYHPLLVDIKNIMLQEQLNPLHITSNFSFPPFEPGNFRNRKELGGGALFDLGPYAISPGRIFFGEIPKEIHSVINSFDQIKDIETSFSILLKYSEGRSLMGHFGFNTEYVNRLNIIGSDFSIVGERVFTPPNDIENEFIIRRKNISTVHRSIRSNCFLNFIQEVMNSIKKNNFNSFREDILNDSIGLDMLINNTLK